MWRAAFCSCGTEGDPLWMGSISKVSRNHDENGDDYCQIQCKLFFIHHCSPVMVCMGFLIL